MTMRSRQFRPQLLGRTKILQGVRQALVLGLIFVGLGACTDSCYALLASSMRHVLLRGRALPFVRRWVSGIVFIALGLLAATSSAKTTKATT